MIRTTRKTCRAIRSSKRVQLKQENYELVEIPIHMVMGLFATMFGSLDVTDTGLEFAG